MAEERETVAPSIAEILRQLGWRAAESKAKQSKAKQSKAKQSKAKQSKRRAGGPA
jgi:hypothetical protein